MQRDAAGSPIWVKHPPLTPGACQDVGATLPKGGMFKLCGPGSWSASRMSCNHHDHKPVTFEHPTNQYTSDRCEVYALKDYPYIDGYIGSFRFNCDTTAR